jgi:outer membrane protein assembly factor BamD
VHVARYYYKRGAYIAASLRAKSAIDQFDGAPATKEAMQILINCYDQLHLAELATQARTVYAANFSSGQPEQQKKSWWKFW